MDLLCSSALFFLLGGVGREVWRCCYHVILGSWGGCMEGWEGVQDWGVYVCVMYDV